jgi:tetratricopeptide (TPR) repeat protein
MLVVAVASAVAMAGRAEAAPPAAENTAAKAAFIEGERNFQLGKFDAAIEAYARAFGLDPQPAFLFNIALSHRRQYEIDGQVDHQARARELYRNYLRLEPQATNRAGVEKLISDLTAKIDAARGRPEAPPGPVPPVPPQAATASAASGGTVPFPGPVVPSSPAQPAAVLASPPAPVAPPPSSKRRWLIGGTVAAAAVVAALAIVFITRSGPSFDGPGVNVTDMR